VYRESRGSDVTNTSSGASGYFQFMPTTWWGLGQSGLPAAAPFWKQYAVARELYAQQGMSPWASDGC
jgi:hypothetical protein